MRIIPLIVGGLCLMISIIGGIGYSGNGEQAVGVPPCIDGNILVDGSCNVGMNNDDVPVPDSFDFISVNVEVKWSLAENTWVGVVDSSYAEKCPPEESGLTDCTKDEFEYISGGPDADGSFEWDMGPGSYRFVTGSESGTSPVNENGDLIPNEVDFTYHIGMKVTYVIVLVLLGGILIGFGVILNPKEKVMDAIPLNEVERELSNNQS